MTEWQIITTDAFDSWFGDLDETTQDAVLDRLNVLRLRGPSLGRPTVDTVYGPRHSNMKELRVGYKSIRAFFAFDPKRTAIVLCAGSKRGKGQKRWYKQMIAQADDLFDQHLQESKW